MPYYASFRDFIIPSHPVRDCPGSSEVGLNYIVFVFLFSIALMYMSFSVGQRARNNIDKKIAFECGFDPLRNPRIPFSLPYFLVALLFLIFDVEVVLLLGVCFRLDSVFITLSPFRLFLCVLFCFILLVGLIHEINEGSLI